MRQVYQALQLSFSYIKKYPQYWLYFFPHILVTLGDVVIPLIIGYIIILFTSSAPSFEIYRWIVLLIGILLANPILGKISSVNAWNIAFRVAHDFRRDAVTRIRYRSTQLFDT